MLSPYKINFRNPTGTYGNLFGTGAEGDVIISSNIAFPIAENGGYLFKDYRNLTINNNVTVTTNNRCAGLFIRVQDTLTLNGTINMTGKAPYRTDKRNIPLHPWIHYLAGAVMSLEDYKLIQYIKNSIWEIPADGAPVSPEPPHQGASAGVAGTNGQTGGGASGGAAHAGAAGDTDAKGGNGSAGYCFGGGCGGGGGYALRDAPGNVSESRRGNNGKPNCEGGGDPIHQEDGQWHGAGQGKAGGVIIIMAKRIISNNGNIISMGADGIESNLRKTGYGTHDGVFSHWAKAVGHGGASGGGAAHVFYVYKQGNINYNFNGGAGCPKRKRDHFDNGNAVGDATSFATKNGGAGSFKEIQIPEKYILGRYE